MQILHVGLNELQKSWTRPTEFGFGNYLLEVSPAHVVCSPCNQRGDNGRKFLSFERITASTNRLNIRVSHVIDRSNRFRSGSLGHQKLHITTSRLCQIGRPPIRIYFVQVHTRFAYYQHPSVNRFSELAKFFEHISEDSEV